MIVINQIYMTSKDLEMLLEKFKEKEKNNKIGDNLIVYTWYNSSGEPIHIHNQFIVDQERARNQGLMQ